MQNSWRPCGDGPKSRKTLNLMIPSPKVLSVRRNNKQGNALNLLFYGLIPVSGMMLALSFPKPGWSFLAWIGLVPLFLVLEKCKPFHGFLAGFFCGIFFFAVLIYWMARFGYTPWIALSLWMSCFWGLFGWLLSISSKKRNSIFFRLLLPSCFWIGLEWLRSQFAVGFPWGILGYSQTSHLPIIQISSLIGVYGVSFLIVMVNSGIAELLSSDRVSYSRRILPFTISLGLVLLVSLVGRFNIQNEQNQAPNGKSVSVTLLQGDNEDDLHMVWTPQRSLQTVKNYCSVCSKSNSSLLIWPETAVPGYLLANAEQLRLMTQMTQKTHSSLLAGGSFFDEKGRMYNSAFLFSPNGFLLGRYDKVHLVPFGEYVPWRDKTDFFKRWPIQDSDYTSGKAFRVLSFPQGRVGVSICFESAFPEISRAFVRNGAQVLVVITNDGWFGKTSAAAQHAQFSIFRAAENHRNLIRSTTGGISMVIDPNGRVLDSIDSSNRTILSGSIRLHNERTLYSKWGDLFAILCFLAVLIQVIELIYISGQQRIHRQKRS